MPVVKRRYSKAYSHAVIAELQRRGKSSDQALKMFRRFYRPLHRTWGMELNPEAFADEMLRVKHLADTLPSRKYIPEETKKVNERTVRVNSSLSHNILSKTTEKKRHAIIAFKNNKPLLKKFSK